jgi:hypothetical protein
MTASPSQHRPPSSRVWFIVAGLAAVVALIAGAQWWSYEKALNDAAKAYRFNVVEVGLTQPAFNGITTQISGDRYLSDGPEDIVADPKPIALYETITLKLSALNTGAGCAPSNIQAFAVLVDAPGFTVDRIGDASRSRQMILGPQCSLSATPPTAAPPWRWNLMPTTPGNHVITLVLQALDKSQRVIDSREVDIPVFVPTPPEPFSTYFGLLGVVVTVITALIGFWEKFRKPLGAIVSRTKNS